MPNILTYAFSHRDRSGRTAEYRVTVDLDDEAIMDDAASFEIAAATRREGERSWTEIRLQVQVRWSETGEGIVIFSHQGQVLRTVPIKLPKLDAAESEHELVDVGADDALLRDSMSDSALEDVISRIPVPLDPLLGCLLKRAASTAISQTIRCWNANRGRHQGRALATAIIGCLRESSRRMTWTLIKRVAKCLITLGLW